MGFGDLGDGFAAVVAAAAAAAGVPEADGAVPAGGGEGLVGGEGLQAAEAASGGSGGGDVAQGRRVEDPERVVGADGREGVVAGGARERVEIRVRFASEGGGCDWFGHFFFWEIFGPLVSDFPFSFSFLVFSFCFVFLESRCPSRVA